MISRMPTKQEVIDALVLDDVNDIITRYHRDNDTNYLMCVLDECYKDKTYNQLLKDYGERKWLHEKAEYD